MKKGSVILGSGPVSVNGVVGTGKKPGMVKGEEPVHGNDGLGTKATGKSHGIAGIGTRKVTGTTSTKVTHNQTEPTTTERPTELPTAPTNLNDLPHDALVYLFSYFSAHELLKFEVVCKQWLDICLQIWRTFKKVSFAELLNKRPTYGNCVMRWHMPIQKPLITEAALHSLAKRCGKQLRHLESGCHLKMDLNCLNVLASEFPRLQTIDLSKVTPVFPEEYEERPDFDIGSFFGELRQIRMDACFDDSAVAYYGIEQVDPFLFKIFSAMPHIETASLAQNTLFSGSGLLGLSTSIRSLDLGFCRRTTAETLTLVFSSLPNLVHVSLYSNNRLTGACLPFLTAELESIDLSYCDSLDVDSLIQFFKTHRRLRQVQLAHVRGLTDSVLATVTDHLPYLESLNLSCYLRGSYYEQLQHVHDIAQGVKALSAIKSLKVLDLSKNDFVYDASLIGISYGCMRLEELNVAQLANCTALGFSSLGRLDRLRKLDVSENDCVDETVLLSVAHGGNLEFVNARKCSKIKEATVKSMSQYWPNKATVFQVF